MLQRGKSHMPSLKWLGPYPAFEFPSKYIFLVESLLHGQKKELHGRRLTFFQNKSFDVTQELPDYLAYQQNELPVIHRFLDIKRRQVKVEILVKWRECLDEETEWVTLASLREEVPTLVREFLNDLESSGTQRQRTIVSSTSK